MTENKTQKRPNIIRHLLDYKRAMRQCIQQGGNGEEMRKVAQQYGFKLTTPI